MPDLDAPAIAATFDGLTLAAVAVAALVIVGALLAFLADWVLSAPERDDSE